MGWRGKRGGVKTYGVSGCVFFFCADDGAGALGLVQSSFASDDGFALGGAAAGFASDLGDRVPVVCHDGGGGGCVCGSLVKWWRIYVLGTVMMALQVEIYRKTGRR